MKHHGAYGWGIKRVSITRGMDPCVRLRLTRLQALALLLDANGTLRQMQEVDKCMDDRAADGTPHKKWVVAHTAHNTTLHAVRSHADRRINYYLQGQSDDDIQAAMLTIADKTVRWPQHPGTLPASRRVYILSTRMMCSKQADMYVNKIHTHISCTFSEPMQHVYDRSG